MNKDTITVHLGQETKRIEAYLHPVEGLAVHRQLKYVPGKEEHKFTSKWQLTHIQSGTAILRPDECVETMAEAVSIGNQMKDVDWTKPVAELVTDQAVREAVTKAIQNREVTLVEDGVAKNSRRYVVRKSETTGYDVYDTDTETVVITFIHRGFASEKARELNQGGV